MKNMKVDSDGKSAKVAGTTPPPPPQPLPPVPRFSVTEKSGIKFTESVTKQEIAKFWRHKRSVEADHFNSAIKAAARLRARNLSEEDYRFFEESLKENDDKEDSAITQTSDNLDPNDREIRVGIKDWWTKSKYAYLNQTAINSMDKPKRHASTYIPHLYCYKSAPPPPTTTFGIC